MSGPIEIRGGAGEFEAAVIAVVLDHLRAVDKAGADRGAEEANRVPRWVRALNLDVYPDRHESRGT